MCLIGLSAVLRQVTVTVALPSKLQGEFHMKNWSSYHHFNWNWTSESVRHLSYMSSKSVFIYFVYCFNGSPLFFMLDLYQVEFFPWVKNGYG